MLQGLGLPDEQLVHGRARRARPVESSPTTSRRCSSTPATSSVAGELARLLALTERLRGPGGCPWDAAQTHHSLRRHVLEEAYEVAAAIDELPADAPGGDDPAGAYDALEDELGDLLFQVMIHSVLAAEAGAFTIADVARGVHAKLVRRHPHVFGDVEADDARRGRDATGSRSRRTRRVTTSLVEGITPGLPSLIYVQKLLRKAASIGLAPDVSRTSRARRRTSATSEALGAALAALAAAGACARLRRRVGAERVGGPVQGPLRPRWRSSRSREQVDLAARRCRRSCASLWDARRAGPVTSPIRRRTRLRRWLQSSESSSIILVVVLLWLVASGVRVVQEYERGVIFRARPLPRRQGARALHRAAVHQPAS